MENQRRWISYDTFKLIVALILLLVFLVFYLQKPSTPAQANLPPVATITATSIPPATATPQPALAPTAQPTSIPTVVPTAIPSPTATTLPTLAPTATPEATSPAATETPTAAPTTTSCQSPAASRLVVGKTAKVLNNLNLRSEPAIADNIMRVSPAGTVVKVLSGPVCVPYQGSAYLWWQVEAPDGKTGWSAENYLNGLGYYLQPVP